MLSAWDFEDAAPLARAALAIAPALGRLAARCRARGVPVVYANDNRGRWRSDLRQVVRAARSDTRDAGCGARIARLLEPDEADFFVLKPRHSAFHATPLALLLSDLQVSRLVLTGVSADQCVLATAQDARMLGLDFVVPSDTLAAPSAARTRRVLTHFSQVMQVAIAPSARLRLGAPGTPG